MLAIPLDSSLVALAHRGRLLLFCCCLLFVLSGISARTQAPTAQMLWTKASLTGFLAYSPTQPLIAAAQGFGQIALLHPDGTVVQTFLSGQGSVNTLAFAPDGMTLATGSVDGTIKLWRVSDGVCLQTLVASLYYGVYSVAFAPDGLTLASGSGDDTIKLWRVSDGACLRTLIGHTNWVTSVAFAPDGQTLVSAGEDNTIKLWRVSDGACLQTLIGSSSWGMSSVAFAPDGMTLASGNFDGTFQLWRVSDGACLQTLIGSTYNGICSVAFAPDGKTLASGNGDSTIRLWRVSDGACLQTLAGHTGEVSSVAFAPDGQSLASGCMDSTIKLWRVSDGTCLQTLTGQKSYLTSVAFAPNGQTLASGGDDGVALQSLPLTDVTLTASPPSPSTIGATVQLSATTTGGIHPEYKFYAVYLDASGKYQLLPIRNYGAASTCSWTPTFTTFYTLVVCCREQGETVPYTAYGTLGLLVKPALSAVTLTVTPTSSTSIGTTVQLHAAPTGGAHPEYKFYAVYLGRLSAKPNNSPWPSGHGLLFLHPCRTSQLQRPSVAHPGASTLTTRAGESDPAHKQRWKW